LSHDICSGDCMRCIRPSHGMAPARFLGQRHVFVLAALATFVFTIQTSLNDGPYAHTCKPDSNASDHSVQFKSHLSFEFCSRLPRKECINVTSDLCSGILAFQRAWQNLMYAQQKPSVFGVGGQYQTCHGRSIHVCGNHTSRFLKNLRLQHRTIQLLH
jgi:hypothetical protein